MNTSSKPGTRLTRAAGIATIAIATLHFGYMMIGNSFWPGWIAGELRNGDASIESVAQFWAQPGGFSAAVLILGLLIVRAANHGDQLPAYVGWVLLGWVALCLVIAGPLTGFSLALIPAGLLIAANLRGRGASRVQDGQVLVAD